MTKIKAVVSVANVVDGSARCHQGSFLQYLNSDQKKSSKWPNSD